jgi:tripartite-type tricarboxylate transporter receptor subunit TctC
VKELGYPVMSFAFGGLFAPKGLPVDIAKKIESACEKNRRRRAIPTRRASGEPGTGLPQQRRLREDP